MLWNRLAMRIYRKWRWNSDAYRVYTRIGLQPQGSCGNQHNDHVYCGIDGRCQSYNDGSQNESYSGGIHIRKRINLLNILVT